jgi:acetyl esterase
MPVHPLIAARFPLISQISNLEEALSNPEAALAKAAYEAPYASYSLPDVTIESTSITGPYGDIPVRVYRPPASGGRHPVYSGCTAEPSLRVISTWPRLT